MWTLQSPIWYSIVLSNGDFSLRMNNNNPSAWVIDFESNDEKIWFQEILGDLKFRSGKKFD